MMRIRWALRPLILAPAIRSTGVFAAGIDPHVLLEHFDHVSQARLKPVSVMGTRLSFWAASPHGSILAST